MSTVEILHYHLPEPETGFTDIILLKKTRGARSCIGDDCIKLAGKDPFTGENDPSHVAKAFDSFHAKVSS